MNGGTAKPSRSVYLLVRRPLVRTIGVLAVLAFLPPFLLAQARIEGQVLNRTGDRPVPGQEVSLLAPRQGMQKVAAATTDSSGHFIFDQSGIEPRGFYLLEAVFQGVPYHAPVLFQSTQPVTVNLEVYEHTSAPSVLSVESLLIGVRAAGNKVDVQEQFTIQNSSRPPRAFVDPRGTFSFHLWPGASEPTVSVKGLMDMDLPQNVGRGRKPGDYAIHYPLKPGANLVTVSYQADYSTSTFHLENRLPYAVGRAELYVMPSSLRVESSNFKPAGADTNNNVQKLAAESLAPGALLQADVSGRGLPETAAGGAGNQQGGPAGTEPTGPQGSGSDTQVKVAPTPITNQAFPILGCFVLVLLWALGVRLAKEWPRLKRPKAQVGNPGGRKVSAKADKLLNSMADLDELFAGGKLNDKDYWRERLELKARVIATLKKTSSPPAEPYASRRSPR